MKKTSVKLFDVLKIQLNGMKKIFVIEALVVPQISSPITNQTFAYVSQNYSHLRSSRPDVFCEKVFLEIS